METSEIKVGAVANWFGRNSTNAAKPAELMGWRRWLCIPFFGGGAESEHFDATTIVALDLHRHQINMCRVIGTPAMLEQMMERVDATPFSPDELDRAQRLCAEREAGFKAGLFRGADVVASPDVDWAAAFFIASWMGQGGRSGCKNEFGGGLSYRMKHGGGDSCKRWKSARESLAGFGRVFVDRFTFLPENAFDFIPTVEDGAGYGVYADPPWPDAGKPYKFGFTEADQRRLAGMVSRFEETRVVMRFGDHPLVRELYPESHWRYVLADGRDQHNEGVKEVFLVNKSADSVA